MNNFTHDDPLLMGWSKAWPTAEGIYWHWTGDPDCSPVPLSVLKSLTTDTCFVSMGQWGWDRPEDCHDIGGWWMECKVPQTPESFCP